MMALLLSEARNIAPVLPVFQKSAVFDTIVATRPSGEKFWESEVSTELGAYHFDVPLAL